jgi:hypothetical protein
MHSKAYILFVAATTAVELRDPRFDPFYANFDRDHYVESVEV